MIRRMDGDDRGVSTVISHVFAIAITSILVISLVAGANAYLTNQKEQVTRDGLDMIGNRLAAEVAQVDRLSNQSANVTLRATHQQKVAGAPYDVNVEHGSECDTTTVSSEDCLIVASARFDVVSVVPIENETAVVVNQTDPGQFEITSLGRGARSDRTTGEPTGSLVESNMRIGIGSDVERDGVGRRSNLLNIAPTNLSVRLDTSTTAAYPRARRGLDFIVEAEDVDGTVEGYEINFDSKRDSNFEVADSSVSTSDLRTTVSYDSDGTYSGYDEPGRYNITLRVTDEDGATRTFRRRLNVSGLTQVTLQGVGSSTPRGQDVSLVFQNTHNSAIDIQGINLNPSDDSTDSINAGTGAASDGPWELGFDTDSDGIYERTNQSGSDYSSLDAVGLRAQIADVGVFTYARGSPYFPTVSAGDTTEIRFRGVRSGGDDTYEVTVTYVLDGKLVTTKFETGATAANARPVATFSVSDSNPSVGQAVSFDGTASADVDGSITSYEWDFDGDGSFDATGPTTMTTYSSTGQRTVTLRVTDDSGATDTAQQVVDVGPQSASQVVLVSGSEFAYSPSGFGGTDSGLGFEIRNQGSSDVDITEFSVAVGSGSDAVSLDTSDLSGRNREVCIEPAEGCDGSYDFEPYSLGSPLTGLNDTARVANGETVQVLVREFVKANGDPEDIEGDTVEFTVEFGDGSQRTYTVTP